MKPLRTGDLVWYVAYGSNLAPDRLACYVAGGQPAGAERSYVGCRDRTPPRDTVALRLPGRLHFGGVSTVWGGGLAFFGPGADGKVVARGYLLTFGQFSDVVAQEARQAPTVDLVPDGDGFAPLSVVYDAVPVLGHRDGVPMVTMTTRQHHPPAAPSAPYLRTILRGLTDGLLADEAAVAYVMAAAGVALEWDEDGLWSLLVGQA